MAHSESSCRVTRASWLRASRAWLLAWRQLNQGFNRIREAGNQMVLTPPGTLAGAVVDESNKPVANAEVFIIMAISETAPENGYPGFNYLTGKPARDLFSTHTDAAGHFRIESFPTNASAILSVRSPGKALQASAQDLSDVRAAGYRAGDQSIKLVLEPAASIEGKLVAEGSNQPPPAALLTLQPDQPVFYTAGAMEPVQSAPDGAFRFEDVAAGSYGIHAVFGTNAPPDWVAEAVPVTVRSGKPRAGRR